jgi:hypothetical protein
MVNVPLTSLQPVPPVSAHIPMMVAPVKMFPVVLKDPVTSLLVRVSVFPFETMRKENVPDTTPSALYDTFNVPVGSSPETGKHPPVICVRN